MNLIKIWKAKGQIAEGIKNSVFKKEHVESIARERLMNCYSCQFIDRKGDRCEMPGTQPCCAECGCSLKFKVRSLSSSCPKGFWNAIVNDEEEDMINDYLGI